MGKEVCNALGRCRLISKRLSQVQREYETPECVSAGEFQTDSDRVEVGSRACCVSRKMLDAVNLSDGDLFHLFCHDYKGRTTIEDESVGDCCLLLSCSWYDVP